MRTDLAVFCVAPTNTIREALARIDRNAQGIALVVDGTGRLLDTVTDGDVRRAILAGVELEAPVSALQNRRLHSASPKPVTAQAGAKRWSLVRLMLKHGIQHIPLLDSEGRVVALAILSELVAQGELPLHAVIMAGGYGTRLHPLTLEFPKPMLPIGNQPLLAWTLHQLGQAGVREATMVVHYQADIIMNYFGDGNGFGVHLRYVKEERPLGTAGALGLLEASDVPFLVINADILTQVDVRSMLEFHQAQRAVMTLAVRQHDVRVPFGVVETDQGMVTGIAEKPVVAQLINAGVYVLNSEVCRYVQPGQACDMPDVITRIIADRGRVAAFPVQGYWLDIGNLWNYEQAQHDASQQQTRRHG